MAAAHIGFHHLAGIVVRGVIADDDFGRRVGLRENAVNGLADKGEHDKALADYAEAIRHDPQFLAAYNNLAWLLATRPERQLRDGPRAVVVATKACELTAWKNAECLDTLAAANAEAGDFSAAEQWEKRALEITHPGATAYRQFSQRLSLYRSNQPYRQVKSSP